MPLVVLTLTLTVSLLLIKLLLLPFDWLHTLSMPIWFYVAGAVVLLSWCLGD
jgi:hypothetical protein